MKRPWDSPLSPFPRFVLGTTSLLALWFFIPFASANILSGELTGKILDSQTRTPIVGAEVTLLQTGEISRTRREGVYLFQGLREGHYTLKVEARGYLPRVVGAIPIRAGQLTQRHLELTPAAPRLEGVTVEQPKPSQSPATHVNLLSRQEFQDRNVTTFDQALELASGIQIQRSHSAIVQSLSIRGSSDVAGGGVGNRVLLLIDGRPAISPETGGALWSIVPTNAIDRVEIVKGAASSLYGSSAMGGVINVITRNPRSDRRLTLHTNVGFYEQPEAFRYTSKTPFFGVMEWDASLRRGKWGLFLNAGRKASDGHSEQSAYALTNFYGKTNYTIDRDREIRLSLGYNLLENDYPHTWISRLQPLQVLPKYSDDRQRKRELSADLYYHAIASTRTKYSSRFYYYQNRSLSTFNEDDPQLKRSSNQPYRLRTHVRAQRFGNLTQVDVFLREKHYWTMGFDTQYDRVRSAPETIMYGDHDAWNLAVYSQYEWHPHPRVTLTGGIRYDYNRLIEGPSLSNISPRLALTYRPWKKHAFRLLSGQAFRAPSIAERFFRKEIAGGIDFKPNPDLRAERLTRSHELGWNFEPVSNVSLDLAYYYNRYKDMIYWVDISQASGLPLGTLFQVRNLNDALLRGLDVTLRVIRPNWLRVQASYSYLDAQDRSLGRKDDTLAYKIRHTVSYGIHLRRGAWALNLSGRFRSRVEEVFLWPNDEPEAFQVHHARLTYQRGQAQVYLAVNNLLDAPYEELARYRMPGRHWTFGVRFTLE